MTRERVSESDTGSRVKPPRKAASAERGGGRSGHPLGRLQEAHGNHAVQQIVKERIQPKLEVGPPNDRYEREADQVARAVTRGPAPPRRDATDTTASGERVQRMCPRCQKRHTQGKPFDYLECGGELQRSANTSAMPAVDDETTSRIRASRGRGQSLPDSVQSRFEPQFGTSFGDVRVHTGARAQELNQVLGAKAFTYGQDIYFGAGEYRPETAGGEQLLAHELTHTVQQTRHGGTARVQRAPDSEDDEQESGIFGMLGSALGLGPGASPALLMNLGAGLLGKWWLGLDDADKRSYIDVGTQLVLKVIDSFPGTALMGEMWTIVQAGLRGFYTRLQSLDMAKRIAAIDTVARIAAGRSVDFAISLLKGIVQGFFVDGLAGIFIAIGELIQALGNLWDLVEAVGKVIGRFPEFVQSTIDEMKALTQTLAQEMGTAVAEAIMTLLDPARAKQLVDAVVEQTAAMAERAGGLVAEELVEFFSKREAEGTTGRAIGRIVGMVLFEAALTALTAGAGAAVTGVKVAARWLAKIGAQLVNKAISVFRLVVRHIGNVVSLIRQVGTFLKGKILPKIATRVESLLGRIKDFSAFVLRHCRKGSIKCDFPGDGLIRRITGTQGLEHSFDRHASQWFGRPVPRETHLDQWQALIERAARSKQTVPWRTGGSPTVLHHARIEGKHLVVQFFTSGPRAGELATAFVPSQRQLGGIFRRLRQGRRQR